MNKLRKLVVTVPFCIALTAPLFVPAATAAPVQDRDDHDHDHDKRYYDAEHKDYHEWNSAEQRYWRQYWANEHRPYIDWDRASDEQRRAYWRWRHEHEEHHDH